MVISSEKIVEQLTGTNSHAGTRLMNSAIAMEILAKQTDLFVRLQRGENLPPFPAGVKGADQRLQQVGEWLWTSLGERAVSTEKPLCGDCIVATVLYDSGGHTAVIRDLVGALPRPPLALWLTMAHPSALTMKRSSVVRAGMVGKIRFFPGYKALGCARQMVAALAQLRPERLFLLHHPEDCIAVVVAAAAQAMGTKIVLLHHADRTPSAGIFLTDLSLVDLNSRCAAFTHNKLGLHSALLPLSCPDHGKRDYPFLSDGSLTTALSGSAKKVAAIASPAYPGLVTSVLLTTGGRHVHIGPLPARMIRNIRGALQQNGLDAESFVHVPKTTSLETTLRHYSVDLMINTYPRGGAKTAVESMASGVPMLWNSPDPDLDEMRLQMKYPQAPFWRNQDELKQLLQSIDREWLMQQSTAARRWYEQKHHPKLWADFFSMNQFLATVEWPDSHHLEFEAAKEVAEELRRRQSPIRRQWRSRHRFHAAEIAFEAALWTLWPPLASLLRGKPLRYRSIHVG